MKKSNEQSLGEIIQNVIKDLKWTDKINQTKIISSWKKIMGPNISSYTDKLVISNDVLIVYLKSAPLRQELQYAKTKIIKNINDEFGSEVIKDIHFK